MKVLDSEGQVVGEMGPHDLVAKFQAAGAPLDVAAYAAWLIDRTPADPVSMEAARGALAAVHIPTPFLADLPGTYIMSIVPNTGGMFGYDSDDISAGAFWAPRDLVPPTETWEVRSLDVWGNEEDGWEVNDVYKSGTIEARDETEFTQQLYEHDFLSAEGLRIAEIECVGEDSWEVRRKDNGKPLYFLERKR